MLYLEPKVVALIIFFYQGIFAHGNINWFLDK